MNVDWIAPIKKPTHRDLNVTPKTEVVVIKTKVIKAKDESDGENDKVSPESQKANDSTSDSGSNHSNSNKKRSRLIKIYRKKSSSTASTTPKEQTVVATSTSSNNGWANPMKKSLAHEVISKPTTQTVISESQTAINLKKKLQEKIDLVANCPEFKEFEQKPFDNLNKRKNVVLPDDNLYSTLPSKTMTEDQLEQEVAKKMICQTTGRNYFHKSVPIFGFPVLFKTNKNGQILPSVICEFLSLKGKKEDALKRYDSKSKRLTTKKGVEYDCWLPLYINEEHFDCVGKKLEEVIVRMSKPNKEGEKKEFNPSMILEVLIPILINIVSQLFMNVNSKSFAALLEGFGQVYFLLKKLLSIYPELQEMIDSNIDSMMEKGEVKSFEEFFIKLLFSTHDLTHPKISHMIFKEFLLKQVPLSFSSNGAHSLKINSPNFLSSALSSLTKESRHILLLRELVTLFKTDTVNKELKTRYGFLDQNKIEMFTARVSSIFSQNTSDWDLFLKEFGVTKYVTNLKDLVKYIVIAYEKTL